ncbi:MAG: leucyl/phenylalanyl-tRNA--protein transferase, partial [Granulosicoccus sp.]
MSIPFLAPDDNTTPFPAVDTALHEPNGLLMAGASLSPRRLIAAYQGGIFPWYEEGEPILWWSPNPRCVIFPQQIKISRSLRKSIRNKGYDLSENSAYRDVMTQCGAPREGSSGTWVTKDMIDAYCKLNLMGIARSVEVWQGDTLVGGLYGMHIGRVFVGESMFSRARDASKAALVHLALCGRYQLIDCQLETEHLRSMGATTISRAEYLELLHRYGDFGKES